MPSPINPTSTGLLLTRPRTGERWRYSTAMDASRGSDASTHDVFNVAHELCNYNMYREDAALTEAIVREGASWAHDELMAFGQLAGSAQYLELGVLANRYP